MISAKRAVTQRGQTKDFVEEITAKSMICVPLGAESTRGGTRALSSDKYSLIQECDNKAERDLNVASQSWHSNITVVGCLWTLVLC